MFTVGEPGAHGDAVAGIHGIGVNTPRAAAVAEATIGFAMDIHMPKGGIFIMGTLSIMVAPGEPHMVLFRGSTFSELGAMPNVHMSIAPEVTS